MRFLILSQYYPPEPGAPQVRLSALARELARRGHRVVIVTAMPNYPDALVHVGYRGRVLLREKVDGIAVIRTWIYPATGVNVPKRLASYLSFTVSSLLGAAMSGGHDFVFVESPPLLLGISGWLYSKLIHARLILNVSDLWPESAEALGIVTNRRLIRIADWLAAFLYRRSYRVTAVSDGIADSIRARVSDPTSVALLPNGVDTVMFQPVAPQDLPSSVSRPDRIIFTYAGTHGYAQGLDVILAAARQLADEKPEVLFRFVGDGPVKPDLQAEVSLAGLRNVEFVPSQPVESMAAWFSASRASIVPLRDLPLFASARPSKIMPSLASSVPVIFAGTGETADLIERERCGIVIPPEDPAALARAVRTLASDPMIAKDMGARGRAMAIRAYRWDAIVHRFLEGLQ